VIRLLAVAAIVVLSAASVLGASIPQHCTTFAGSDGTSILVGNNEDCGNPVINLWFLPADGERYGRFLIGTEGTIQGGMNEQGLVFDSLAIPLVGVPFNDRPLYDGMWSVRALETCATVEEVVAFYEAYAMPGPWTSKLFFADATGDAVLLEGNAVVRKEERFLVSTNFLQSETAPEGITCERFLSATASLEGHDVYSAELFRDILDAVHVKYDDGAGTVYSTIYDLGARSITCYLYADFEHPIVFDLGSELAAGARAWKLDHLLTDNEAFYAWRDRKLETFARQMASSQESPVHPESFRAYTGQYAVQGEPILNPPATLSSVSIVPVGNRLSLVACPESISYELFPVRGDQFRVATLSNSPDLDVAFLRADDGAVTGMRLVAAGAEYTLDRVGGEPKFEPLEEFMAELPTLGDGLVGPVLESGRRRSVWIGALALAAGLVALVVALSLP